MGKITVAAHIKEQIDASKSHLAVFDRVIRILSCYMKLKALQHLPVTVRAIFQQKVSHGVYSDAYYFILIDCQRDSRSFLTLFSKWSIYWSLSNPVRGNCTLLFYNYILRK